MYKCLPFILIGNTTAPHTTIFNTIAEKISIVPLKLNFSSRNSEIGENIVTDREAPEDTSGIAIDFFLSNTS